MVDKKPIKFDTTGADLHGNAYFCVVLSCLAYKPQMQIETELVEYGYNGTNVLFLRSSLVTCFILRWDDVTAIAFKGSTTWREWLNNCNVWPEPVQHGRVHAGFLYTINQMGPAIYKIIYPDLLSGKKIVATGHSRGGALAILFAFFLALNGHRAHSIFTFGSPRVGDREFASLWGNMPAESAAQTKRTLLTDFVNYLMRFKVIFIPVSLYLSFRVLVPHPMASIWKRLLRSKKANDLEPDDLEH